MVWLLNFQVIKNFKIYSVIPSQHNNYLQKWLAHLSFDQFIAAVLFSSEIPKYVQA